MPRPCTICEHPKRGEINKALVDSVGVSSRFRQIADRFGVGFRSVERHATSHLTQGLKRAIVKHAELVEETRDFDAVASLKRAVTKLERFLDAADEWLQDPNRPGHYDLSPRDHEVLVIWEREVEREDGNGFRRVKNKEKLTEILRRCRQLSDSAPDPSEIRVVEVDAGNVRKLMLDAVTAAKPVLEVIGKAIGQIQKDATIEIHVHPEVVELRRRLVTWVMAKHPAEVDEIAGMLEAK